jgi:predicted nucleic acid-binding protein
VSFVVDCSVALAWCFADEASAAGDALLERLKDEGGVVPALWHLEVGNVLLQAERRGRIAPADLSARIDLLRKLPVVTDEGSAARALDEILALARAHRLTTYDAAYLELAARRGLPLATKDSELLQAAERIGVPVLPARAA